MKIEQNEMNIDIREIFGLIRKWWWIPTLLALVLGIFVGIKSYFFTPKVYQANTTIYLISKEVQDDRNGIQSDLRLGDLLIKDYIELVKQRSIAREVIKELNLENSLSPDALLAKMKVNAKNDTRLLQITISDQKPVRAMQLADKIAEVFTQKVVQTNNVQIVDRAELPILPVSPQPMKNIGVAILIGLVLGIGVILLLDYLDNTIKTQEDIKKNLQWNTLATLPLIETDPNSTLKMDKSKIITVEEPKSTVSEQYRVLRTSIMFKAMDRDIKKIMVTSSAAGEGKSTTTVNLGVVLAQNDSKVLLVDADLRKATLNEYFNLNFSKGLTTCLAKNGDPEEYIIRTPLKGLDIITSGPFPPDPSELLGSKAMKNFLEIVSKKYDYILFDLPPVGIVTDAAVLSTLCDGVIFVVASGSTKIENAMDAKEELKKVGANVLGVVLNKRKQRREHYYYYYYGKEKTV